MKGTISLFYKTNPGGNYFSLSKKLDTISGMKLYKIETINFPKFIKGQDITIDQVNTFIQLNVKKSFDKATIIGVITKYEHDSQKVFIYDSLNQGTTQ